MSSHKVMALFQTLALTGEKNANANVWLSCAKFINRS